MSDAGTATATVVLFEKARMMQSPWRRTITPRVCAVFQYVDRFHGHQAFRHSSPSQTRAWILCTGLLRNELTVDSLRLIVSGAK